MFGLVSYVEPAEMTGKLKSKNCSCASCPVSYSMCC